MSAKIRLFKLAEGSTWEAIDAQQRARCIPVLRLPQGDWAPQDTHSEQWVYSLANAGGTPSAEWFPCYFDVQSGRWTVIPTGAGSKFYKVLEDYSPGFREWVWAAPVSRSGVYPTGSPENHTKLYGWEDLLENVKYGYVCMAEVVGGELCFKQGPCISGSCGTGDAISGNQPTEGTVGTSYTFTFSTTGISGSLITTGLPPGLTRSGNTISGTPTTAGDYYTYVTGSVTIGETSCPVRRVFRFTIVNPPEE